MSSNSDRHGRERFATGTALAGLAFVLVAFFASRVRSSPPSALGFDAPDASFSAERALAALRQIEGEGRPHPVGSAESARVRAFLVAELERQGFKVEIQPRLAVSHAGVVAIVQNVIATRPGREAGPRVLLCAHYDSVSAGPGSSDDGAGTASILEIARALHESEALPNGTVTTLRNGIVLLLDEGEEAGLIGAKAFVESHPLEAEIGVVVNLEARGTSGRAHMFETSNDNAWLISHYARSVPHPSAISVAYELYKRMPNDTDLTVFKAAGIPGLNVAFIGGLQRYHTPRDDVAHLDPGSLQHLGETGLALARSLGDADLAGRALVQSGGDANAKASLAGNAMYTDVLGLFMLRWREGWCTWIAIAAWLVLLVRALRSQAKPLVVGMLGALAALIGAAVVAHGIALALVALRGVESPWSAHPAPLRIAVLFGSLAGGLFVGRWALRRGSRVQAAAASAHLVIATLALIAAIAVPSASYLLLIPSAVAAIAVLLGLMRARKSHFKPKHGRPGTATLLVVLAVAALFAMPLLVGLEEAFGFRIGAALGVPVGIVALLLAPAFLHGGARTIGAVACVAVLAFVVAWIVPAYNADSPSVLNLGRVTDARAKTAMWAAFPFEASLPPEVAKAGGFTDRREAPVPWYPRFRSSFVAATEPSREAPPRLDVVREANENGKRVVVAHLSSPRGALRLGVRIPDNARLRAVLWKDQRITAGLVAHGVAPFTGIGPEGVELEIEIDGASPIDVDLLDASPLTDAAARPLLDARPTNAVPRGEGDTDVILDRVRL